MASRVRRFPIALLLIGGIACSAPSPTSAPPEPAVTPEASVVASPIPVELRLGVSLDAATLNSFAPAVTALDAQHPEWTIVLEQTPQQDRLTKLNAQIASQTLPDVVLIDGLSAQQFIRQGAFIDMTPLIQQDALQLADYYPGTVEQFAYDGKQWGLPAAAAPEVVFYNKAMFDAANLDYPSDEWTFEDMRAAARQLTIDSAGNNAADPVFDPQSIVQWGWNNSPGYIWTNHFVQPFGANYCANEDCTRLQMTEPQVVAAFQWWADMVQQDHSALFDPYGGSQTGVPGDPFIAGKAAMGFNGFFAVGQLNQQTTIDYDIVQPFQGRNGKRYSALSIQGYVISGAGVKQKAAWQLVRALNDGDFLSNVWGEPGHFIPAVRRAAPSILNAEQAPRNQMALLDVMEYAQVLKPYSASAFEVYDKTQSLFLAALKGDTPVPDALRAIEETANEILAQER
ncbi:MAG: extracellular solute-binding protein [Chloroflexales bacterium]|nr:extracellular solute-binding protein [Chloroflexales bacterium]